MEKNMKISAIIPSYNEEMAVSESVNNLIHYLSQIKNEREIIDYEIIVIDDASTDRTNEILQKIHGIKIITHPYNKGYGASLKTGVKHSQCEWLLFFDADGQHKPEYIKEFLKYANQYDMIIGSRQGYKGPFWRQPGKKLIHWIANYLAGRKIPDLNCGLRLLKRECFLRFNHILPDGFSLSTTTTLAFFKEGLNVKYVPVTINKRTGRSSLKVTDGFKTLMLTVRLIMLFSPLKIFVPIAIIGFIASFLWAGYNLINSNFATISKSSGFIFVASLLIFLFGLLADQVAAIRRELKRN